MNALQNRLLAWADMSVQLKKLRAEEAEVRRELCEAIIDGEGMVNGRVTVKANLNDINAKAVQALAYKVDDKALRSIWSELSDLEQASVVYKPSLSLTTYKKLPEDSILHDVVTTSLAMPTLTVEFNDA